jgi:hypothetical protein
MWIVIVMGIFAMATMALLGHRRVGDLTNLGYVSERWLSEYRAEQRGDSM